jgi:hypothetical protein
MNPLASARAFPSTVSLSEYSSGQIYISLHTNAKLRASHNIFNNIDNARKSYIFPNFDPSTNDYIFFLLNILIVFK